MKKKVQKPDNYKKEIKGILDNFDFVKVMEVMDFLNWTWVKGDNRYFPDISDLKKCARSLLVEAVSEGEKKHKNFFISVGGFEVDFFYTKEEVNILQLRFVIEHWEEII